MSDTARAPTVAWGSPRARWVLAAAVLGSGMAFLDGTIVNVALPAMARDLDADLADLQWVLDAYLVTLTALVLLGGALGDRFGRRRVFTIGVGAFAVASVLCGVAPTTGALIAARALQGVGAAMLVPGSLALLSATMRQEDRARAIGAWSGLTGVASALGPFFGGWLVDAASWRWAFLINLPLAVVVLVATRRVPESTDPDAPAHLDLLGATIVALGLASLTAGLIEAGAGWTVLTVAAVIAGVALLGAFVVVERRSPAPMLPPALFRSRQFTGANLVTLAVYAGLGGAFFFVVVNLQDALGYSALESGAALTPVTVVMLLLSSRMGAMSQRTGPRLPMTVGPAIVALGLLLLGQIEAGDKYLTTVLPAALVFGLGLSVTVAPLTAAVLGAVDEHHLGVGAGTNNAVARLAGLLAVAVIPSLAGFELTGGEGSLPGYTTAMRISAALAVAGSLIAALTVGRGRTVTPVTHPIMQPCQDPALTSSSHR
jgi:EmrB/QacA subfamily drug resistance transporter